MAPGGAALGVRDHLHPLGHVDEHEAMTLVFMLDRADDDLRLGEVVHAPPDDFRRQRRADDAFGACDVVRHPEDHGAAAQVGEADHGVEQDADRLGLVFASCLKSSVSDSRSCATAPALMAVSACRASGEKMVGHGV